VQRFSVKSRGLILLRNINYSTVLLTFLVPLHKCNECEIFSPKKMGIILGN